MTQAELLQHINDHILMVIPSGISRADCLNAVRPWHQDVSLEQAAPFLDDPNALLNEALKAVCTQWDLINFASLDLGLVECHWETEFLTLWAP